MARSRSLYTLCVCLFILVAGGCDSAEVAEAPTFAEDALSNTTYNVVVLDEHDAVILLGELAFGERQENAVSGSWQLSPWGEQASFAALPGDGSFTGLIHGQAAIVQIALPETEATLGLIIEGVLDDRLVGSLRLLPGSEFEGRFEAIANRS